MSKTKLLLMLFAFLSQFLLVTSTSNAQTKVIEDFESYESDSELGQHWRVFGFASKDYGMIVDTSAKVAPGGTKYFKYVYSSEESTWGGVAERRTDDASFFPLDLGNTKGGLQFYLKGDGTNNVIRFRFYQFFDEQGTIDARWRSHPISLSDTSWHIVTIPFVIDTTDNYGLHLWYTNGPALETEEDMRAALGEITRFQINIDRPDTNDTEPKRIYFDDFRAVDFIPPHHEGVIKIGDFEEYVSSEDFQTKWQGFGYGTLDYELGRNDLAPEGYKNAQWFFQTEERTTWGIAFRSREVLYKIPDLSSIGPDGGIQFLLKGDGTDDLFMFRLLDEQINHWASNWISLKDTNWHVVTIPFVASETKGFRWLGNDPNSTCWDCPNKTTEEFRESLSRIVSVRWDKRFFSATNPSYIDSVLRSIEIDGVYAVNEFPPLEPEAADDFETYTDSDNLKTAWNQFGSGSVSLDLSESEFRSGAKSMAITYNGSLGFTAVRKRNIIPGLNFSELKGGMQFYLKGDGSNNKITLRLMNGDEMWESAELSMSNTGWVHLGVGFSADSINGFRYLGNDPPAPVWSDNVGTDEQLKGDLSNIDQVRFYIRNPESINEDKVIYIDKIEGVDRFSSDTITDVENDGNQSVPFEYKLVQNYPNPFNPTTTIKYSLRNPGTVSLRIFNILGQEVATLVNDFKKAGAYQVSFDASKLATGVYVYQLQAGSFIQFKKMLLLK